MRVRRHSTKGRHLRELGVQLTQRPAAGMTCVVQQGVTVPAVIVPSLVAWLGPEGWWGRFEPRHQRHGKEHVRRRSTKGHRPCELGVQLTHILQRVWGLSLMGWQDAVTD